MDVSFAEAARRFLDHCLAAKSLSAHTIRAYAADLAHAEGRLGRQSPVASIGRDELRRYVGAMLQDEKLKETSVKRRLATIRQLFKWLEREEVVAISPFHRLDVTIRLPRRLPRALGSEDMRRLIATARSEAALFDTHAAHLLHFVVVALFVSGLRIGELAGIRLPDVDLAAGTVRVRGKGNRERQVYLPGSEARRVAEDYLRARGRTAPGHDALLVSPEGRPVTPQYLRRRLKQAAARAGIRRPVTPHMLRHTAATQLIEAGVDIRFVQKLLGHASIATTQIYTQVSDSSLRTTLEQADTLGRVGRGR